MSIGVELLSPTKNSEDALNKLAVVQDPCIVSWNINAIDLAQQGLQLGLGETIVDWHYSGSAALEEFHMGDFNKGFIFRIAEEGLSEDSIDWSVGLNCSSELHLARVLLCVVFVLHTV